MPLNALRHLAPDSSKLKFHHEFNQLLSKYYITSTGEKVINKIYTIWINSPAESFDKLRTKIYQKKRTMNFSECSYVFFLSTGRVGTKTIAALLSIADSYDVYHEPRPLLYNLSKISYATPITTHSIKLINEAFLIARKNIINLALIKKKGYIETSPQVTFLAPFLAESFPNSKFIHLIRNPYDVFVQG